MARRSLVQRLVRAWESVQVELNGEYSQSRLHALREYASHTSIWRALLVVAATPVPCLLAVIAADAIPLEPPENGPNRSFRFWSRLCFTNSVFTLMFLLQCVAHIPELALSRSECAAIVFSVVSTITALTYVVARTVGFPIPFAISLFALPWVALCTTAIWIPRRRLIRENEDLRSRIKNYLRISSTQAGMTVVYQAFFAAFSWMSATNQTKAAVVMPLFKLAQKNLIGRLMHDHDDMKPEVLTFNVELFHAMFVSCCMQRTTSIYTSLVLIVADFAQACLSLYDLSHLLSALERLAETNGIRKEEFVDVALLQITNEGPLDKVDKSETENAIACFSSSRSVWAMTAPRSSREGPEQQQKQSPALPPNVTRIKTIASALSGRHKLIFARNFRRAMFLTEFLLLIEFVEAMIPATYCVYLITLFHLPTRVFYPQFADMDSNRLHATIQNVLAYATMELCSFVALALIIQRRLQISGVRQLAFVLETQGLRVQSKLVLWFIFVLQSTLVHLGADYSFEFAWLHTPSTSLHS